MAVSEMGNERSKDIENKLGIPTMGQVVHFVGKEATFGINEEFVHEKL